jgi:hypothetical protein
LQVANVSLLATTNRPTFIAKTTGIFGEYEVVGKYFVPSDPDGFAGVPLIHIAHIDVYADTNLSVVQENGTWAKVVPWQANVKGVILSVPEIGNYNVSLGRTKLCQAGREVFVATLGENYVANSSCHTPAPTADSGAAGDWPVWKVVLVICLPIVAIIAVGLAVWATIRKHAKEEPEMSMLSRPASLYSTTPLLE